MAKYRRWVLTLAVGVRCAFFGAGPSRGQQLEKDAFELNINKLRWWCTAFPLSYAVFRKSRVATTFITQPLLAIASLKWAVVFLLFVCSATSTPKLWRPDCLHGLEFATGLFGVFSGFKNVFLVFMIAALASRLALHGRRLQQFRAAS